MILEEENAERTGTDSTRTNTTSILNLPDDALFAVLSFCDLQSLGRTSQTCQRLHKLINHDCVWTRISRNIGVIGDCRTVINPRWKSNVSAKDQCRASLNWKSSHCRDVRLIHHRVKQIPWLQLYDRCLWVSYKNVVRCCTVRNNGSLHGVHQHTLHGSSDDVSHFVAKDHRVVTGSRDGSVLCFSSDTACLIWGQKNGHHGDVQAVDFHGNTIVSGSRDATLKVWSMETGEKHTIPAEDRVWSIALSPSGASFISGTAGINHVPPLRLWNADRGELQSVLGSQYKNGAGVLDIQYESPSVVLSCGYDTFIRMWDLRASHAQCIKQWEEPFDSTVYCVKSDGNNTMVAGTSRYGLVRLWDKRWNKPLQMYYTGKSRSPVYSLAFDVSHLYVALDVGINMLDFSIR